MRQHTKIAVLIISTLKGGGAERSVLTLGQGFYDLGYQVHILRFKSFTEYDLNPNLNYHVLKFKPFRLIPHEQLRYRLFARAVDKFILGRIGQPDIVLSNLEPSDRVMAHSKLPNIMYVIRNNISHKFGLANNACAKTERLSSIFQKHPCVCISRGVEKDLQSSLGSNITTTTIYNPLDTIEIKRLSDEKLSSLHKALISKQYLLHVGSFKPQKAHNVLISAYAQSSMMYPLVLLGQGKLQQESKSLAQSLGIADNVIFLGFDKNPYPYMKHAKGLVLSSIYEGFGRVIAEAMVLDTPVVSTDCPSGPSELLPEKNLVPVNDVAALADKMTAIMAQPQDFKVTFDEQFLPKNIAQQFVDYVAS